MAALPSKPLSKTAYGGDSSTDSTHRGISRPAALSAKLSQTTKFSPQASCTEAYSDRSRNPPPWRGGNKFNWTSASLKTSDGRSSPCSEGQERFETTDRLSPILASHELKKLSRGGSLPAREHPALKSQGVQCTKSPYYGFNPKRHATSLSFLLQISTAFRGRLTSAISFFRMGLFPRSELFVFLIPKTCTATSRSKLQGTIRILSEMQAG